MIYSPAKDNRGRYLHEQFGISCAVLWAYDTGKNPPIQLIYWAAELLAPVVVRGAACELLTGLACDAGGW